MIIIFSALSQALLDLCVRVITLLPQSPFAPFIDRLANDDVIRTYLGYVSWLLPTRFIGTFSLVYLSAVATYYFIQLVLRWIKFIR